MRNSRWYQAVGQILCITMAALIVYPLVMMIQRSLELEGLGNYKFVLETFNLIPNLVTSILVVGGTVLLVGIVVSMASFAFSKLDFPCKNIIYYVLLSGMMLPTATLIFPVFQLVKGLNLDNTFLSLVFPYATMESCFNLIILKNFYDSLPNELMEAARIDGGNKWTIFARVMFPIAKPGLALIALQTFMSSWNEMQMSMIFINDSSKQPLSVVPMHIMQYSDGMGFPERQLFAGLVICMLPIVIFYFFTSKFLMDGLTAGAVKG